MKNWILVEPTGIDEKDQLNDWIQLAVKFVGKLPAKQPQPVNSQGS
jgi:hypothetical protein